MPSDTLRATLVSSPETKRLWPHDFRLDYEVKVEGDAIRLTLTETNTGTEPFEAAGGFHPYFKVASPLRVAVNGKPVTTECHRVSEPADGKPRREIMV